MMKIRIPEVVAKQVDLFLDYSANVYQGKKKSYLEVFSFLLNFQFFHSFY